MHWALPLTASIHSHNEGLRGLEILWLHRVAQAPSRASHLALFPSISVAGQRATGTKPTLRASGCLRASQPGPLLSNPLLSCSRWPLEPLVPVVCLHGYLWRGHP